LSVLSYQLSASSYQQSAFSCQQTLLAILWGLDSSLKEIGLKLNSLSLSLAQRVIADG
jgi:hypothetical protein